MAVYTIRDITAALRKADIGYEVVHPDTEGHYVLSTIDGDDVAFGPSVDDKGEDAGGIDLVQYDGSEAFEYVAHQEWLPTLRALVAYLRRDR